MEPAVPGSRSVKERTVELSREFKWGYVLWNCGIMALAPVLGMSLVAGPNVAVALVVGLALLVAATGAVLQVLELSRVSLPAQIFWQLWNRARRLGLGGYGQMLLGSMTLGPFLLGTVRFAGVDGGDVANYWPVAAVFGGATAVVAGMVAFGARSFLGNCIVAVMGSKGWEIRRG